MRLTAIASALFAAAGNTPNLSWIPEAISVPEEIWLALWGLALLGFSSSLRNRRKAPVRVESSQASPELQPLSAGRTA